MPLSRSIVAVAVILSSATLGCAAARAPLTCPAHGGPSWTELMSSHFVMETDVDIGTARAALDDLERTHGALAHVIRRPLRDREDRIEVVLFERERDFFEIAGPERTMGGFYSPRLPLDIEPRPMFVTYNSELAEEVRATFQHELSHRFLHERFARIPTWLDEGLAQYYSTLRIEPGRLVVGGSLPSLDFTPQPFFYLAWHGTVEQLEIPIFKAPTVRQLIEADPSVFYLSGSVESISEADRERQTAFYGAAWKLVQMLLNGRDEGTRAHFEAFLDDIARGESAREAFLVRLGGDWDELERAFRDYLGKARLERVVFEYQPPMPGAPGAHALSDAEVHVLWARLLSRTSGAFPRVKREIDEAHASDPGSPEAHCLRARVLWHQHAYDEALAEVDTALAARPAEPRYLLAAVAMRRARQKALGTKVSPPRDLVDRLARAATTAIELTEVAASLVDMKDPDGALGFVERAIRLNPIYAQSHTVRAAALFQKGRLDEALTAIDRALDVGPEGEPRPEVVELREAILRARLKALLSNGGASSAPRSP